MQWNSTFSIGVEKIDGQHQRLFKLVNRLEQELAGQQSAEIVGEALKFLVDYTRYHFKDEESLMVQINYPDIEAHQAQHKKLIDNVRGILLDIRAGRLHTVADLTSFLYHWIVKHIEQEDKKIGSAILALARFSDQSDTPVEIVRHSTTQEIKTNLTKLQVLRKQQRISDNDAEAYKKNLIDKFILKFNPTSTIEVIEEYTGLKALLNTGLITEAEMDVIRPRFAEKIDLKEILANDNAVKASMAHLNVLVEEKIIDEVVRDHYKGKLLRKIH